ncbi:hypothetical protein Scep_005819 [Stephania cephalantha]|uniref:S-protein homolog n=1 Tax=Stephania cephalantha TaxID=152367 RepID=A0AAP0KW26_9MAGN
MAGFISTTSSSHHNPFTVLAFLVVLIAFFFNSATPRGLDDGEKRVRIHNNVTIIQSVDLHCKSEGNEDLGVQKLARFQQFSWTIPDNSKLFNCSVDWFDKYLGLTWSLQFIPYKGPETKYCGQECNWPTNVEFVVGFWCGVGDQDGELKTWIYRPGFPLVFIGTFPINYAIEASNGGSQ